MSSRRKSNRSKRTSRLSPYIDKGKTTRDFEKWSKSEMTKELFNVGIKVPTDFSLNVMRKLYTENTNKSTIVTSVDECNSNDNIEESTTSAKDTIQHNTSDHASINTTSQGTSVTDNMTLMMTAFNTVSKCVSGLQDTVNNLMKEKIYDVNKQFSLQLWYSKSGETGVQQNSIETI